MINYKYSLLSIGLFAFSAHGCVGLRGSGLNYQPTPFAQECARILDTRMMSINDLKNVHQDPEWQNNILQVQMCTRLLRALTEPKSDLQKARIVQLLKDGAPTEHPLSRFVFFQPLCAAYWYDDADIIAEIGKTAPADKKYCFSGGPEMTIYEFLKQDGARRAMSLMYAIKPFAEKNEQERGAARATVVKAMLSK